MKSSIWTTLSPRVLPLLTADDDAAFWQVAVSYIFAEAAFLCHLNPENKHVQATLGRCTSWRRPHQTRWRADGGFAWPSGYGGLGHSSREFPRPNWTIDLSWDRENLVWSSDVPTKRPASHQLLRFDVVLPGRTAIHRQGAAATTRWFPGSPPTPNEEMLQFYGFRPDREGHWTCTATRGGERAYHLAGDAGG